VEDYKGVKATASMATKEQVDVNENQVAQRDLVNGRWMTRLVVMNRTGTTVSLRGSPHTKEAFSFSICFVCVAAALDLPLSLRLGPFCPIGRRVQDDRRSSPSLLGHQLGRLSSRGKRPSRSYHSVQLSPG
jgi:hypothetical protein